jgi:hypothetical protein
VNDKQRKMMFELFTGTIISQEIIVQTLHRRGLIRKEDVIDRLDFFIDYFEEKGSEQIAVPMRYLRKNLDKQFPEGTRTIHRPVSRYPDWFQGVIPGGRGNNASSIAGD